MKTLPRLAPILRSVRGADLGSLALWGLVVVALEAWGNNVSAEAAALAQYNIALAELERSTGTILEVHGIRMIEERYGSLGPWGRHAPDRWYPESLRPTPPVDRYSNDEVTTEEFFELSAPEEFDANEYENTLPRLPLPDTR